jgi:hypothetical protein
MQGCEFHSGLLFESTEAYRLLVVAPTYCRYRMPRTQSGITGPTPISKSSGRPEVVSGPQQNGCPDRPGVVGILLPEAPSAVSLLAEVWDVHVGGASCLHDDIWCPTWPACVRHEVSTGWEDESVSAATRNLSVVHGCGAPKHGEMGHMDEVRSSARPGLAGQNPRRGTRRATRQSRYGEHGADGGQESTGFHDISDVQKPSNGSPRVGDPCRRPARRWGPNRGGGSSPGIRGLCVPGVFLCAGQVVPDSGCPVGP